MELAKQDAWFEKNPLSALELRDPQLVFQKRKAEEEVAGVIERRKKFLEEATKEITKQAVALRNACDHEVLVVKQELMKAQLETSVGNIANRQLRDENEALALANEKKKARNDRLVERLQDLEDENRAMVREFSDVKYALERQTAGVAGVKI